MVVTATADGFRAVSVHCGASMGEGMSFHTFTLPEDSCVRFLVGRCMPESVVREELESLNIRVQ
jgi:hypothetical protein